MANDKGYLSAAKAHLEAHGETRAKDLADVVGIPMSGLYSAMKGAVARGEIAKRKEGRQVFFGLGDGTMPAEEGEAPPEIRWSIWDDGDLVVYGLQENEDGSHTVPAPVLEAIKKRIAWSPSCA